MSVPALRDDVSVALAVDHSGRSGNGFLLCTFDDHPEVLTCPLMHYTLSYLEGLFGDREKVSVDEARDYWTRTYYFRYFYNDLDDEGRGFIVKVGGDPEDLIDRPKIRATFDALLAGRTTLTRKDLVLATFSAYAVGRGIDPAGIKTVLLSDSVSLRDENVMHGFSGKVIDRFFEIWPEGLGIHLVRDPRAVYASSRHEFVNRLGNMYDLRPANVVAAWRDLGDRNFAMDRGCVWLFWMTYMAQTARTAEKHFNRYRDRFVRIRNEDLNLDFVATLTGLSSRMGVSFDGRWRADGDFAPTMCGRPWGGTGAYNPNYQRVGDGPLRNDPPEVARRATGPNAYVTRRWRDRLPPHEIALLEQLFCEEMRLHHYEFLHGDPGKPEIARVRECLDRFLSAELPGPSWLSAGAAQGLGEFAKRLFYYAALWPFAARSRRVFDDILWEGATFNGLLPER